MVRIGAPSALLLVFAVQALLLAALILRAGGAQLANRYLAALLVVLAGLATPFIIGYAGGYDAWPWLSFAPFAVPLAVGPLLYGYIHALATGKPIARWHFAAPALQFAYQAVVFVLPLATKDAFDTHVQAPFLSPLVRVALPVTLFAYAFAGWRLTRRYHAWVEQRRRSAAGVWRLQFAYLVLAGIALLRLVVLIASLAGPVSYFDLFGFYLALGAVSVWLGVEGWRHADAPLAVPNGEARDWAAQGRAWIDAIAAGALWRDANADLASLARALGANRTDLSRALNAAGESLPQLLARLRVEEVASRLREGDPRDLLTIALDAGFGSKAAFNRAFRDRFGLTPSAYRDQHRAPL